MISSVTIHREEEIRARYDSNRTGDNASGWWQPRVLIVSSTGLNQPEFPEIYTGYDLHERCGTDVGHTISEFLLHSLKFGNRAVLYLGVSRKGAEKAKAIRVDADFKLPYVDLVKKVDELLLKKPEGSR